MLATLAAHGVRPNVSQEVSEVSTVLALVGEQLGVSVIPALAAPGPPATVALRSLTPRAERRLSLAVAPNHVPSPAVRAFLAEAAGAIESSGRS